MRRLNLRGGSQNEKGATSVARSREVAVLYVERRKRSERAQCAVQVFLCWQSPIEGNPSARAGARR